VAAEQTTGMLQARQRMEKFKQGKGSLKFKCIEDGDKGRTEFVASLEKRFSDARKVSQGLTPLCGPAAFMHCIASDRPADFVNYVLDLAETGEARLGGLSVKPSADCRNAVVAKKIIDPVDWVALASLRDTTNTFSTMSSEKDNAAGITFPADMQKWFSLTGWFSGGVSKNTNLASSLSARHLIGINQRTDSHICMLIRSEIFRRTAADIGINKLGTNIPKKGGKFPNHWVVLKGRIQVGLCNPILTCNFDDKSTTYSKGQAIKFSCWCWGEDDNRVIDTAAKNITAEQLSRYYYGYVSAKRS